MTDAIAKIKNRFWVRLFLKVGIIFLAFVLLLTLCNTAFLKPYYEYVNKEELKEVSGRLRKIDLDLKADVVDIISYIEEEYGFETEIYSANGRTLYSSSGGLFGLGFGNSHQKYMYISEPQNDFIFSVICEELGLIGALAILALFAVLLWRGMKIAVNAPDTFGSLLVTGITALVGVQVVLNIAVVTSSIPTTGIPLPFFSAGGSSLFILMAAMGIILNVSRYKKQTI